MSEEPEKPKVSKLSAMMQNAEEKENNTIPIIVHYSEDNWKTNEEINLILDEETTIKELLETSKQKLNNKPNIDSKKFDVMIFKKKKKIPNDEYPVCNLDSKVKDFGKSHFCLVDKENREPKKINEEEIIEKKEEVKDENNNKKIEEKKDNVKIENQNEIKEKDKGNKEVGKNKNNKKNKKCVIF